MKNYEELVGASGRRIFYRAERYRARDLFKRSMPDLSLDQVICRLHDLSMNGLSAYAPRGSNDLRGIGERLPVRLDLRGATLHEGTGEISRLEPTPFGTKVGVRLVDRCVNVSQLVAKYDEALIRAGIEEFEGDARSVAPEYRRLCADVLHLLRAYRTALDRFEKTRPGPAELEDMMGVCEERILPQCRMIWYQANELVAPIMEDTAALRAAKRLTELLITPEFMGAPFVQRAYQKPLGYPGDFRLMEMIYAWRREGPSLSDQLMHRIGITSAECVATRMLMMRQIIAEAILQRSPAPVRITSLGCGAARELRDYLQLRALPASVQFTLIDQDHAALSSAYEQTYAEVMRLQGQAQISCLHASFSQFLKTKELFGVLPPQDLIYSIGLVDYVSQPRAKALTASLYEHLAPGGMLVIGNLNESPRNTRWPMEFICDWSVHYRGERAMKELAAGLPQAEITTLVDRTDCVCFLKVRKPQGLQETYATTAAETIRT
jgi:extracellular factor (EF) 3-hydroxypalmitic acid methyl ester biosynthesis protein